MTAKEAEALLRVVRRLNAYGDHEARRGSNAKANAYWDAARMIEMAVGWRKA